MIEKVLALNFEISSRYFIRFFIFYCHNLTLILLKIGGIVLVGWFGFSLIYSDIPLLFRLASYDILFFKISHFFAVFLNHFIWNFLKIKKL